MSLWYNGPRKLDTKLGSFKLHLGHETNEEKLFIKFQGKGRT